MPHLDEVMLRVEAPGAGLDGVSSAARDGIIAIHRIENVGGTRKPLRLHILALRPNAMAVRR